MNKMTCSRDGEIDADTDSDFDIFFIANITILIVLFLIGLYLQIKIIIESFRQQSVTWKIDIGYSCVMIVFYTFRIFFEIITYFGPVLHLFAGTWFCDIALFINLFGAISLISHSLVVVVYKYVCILHQDFVTDIGTERASTISLWISIILPAALAVSFIARPAFHPYSSVLKCLSVKIDKSVHATESPLNKIKIFLTCGFDDVEKYELEAFSDYLMTIIGTVGCLCTSLLVLILLLNILEALFYHRIFSFIKR